MCRTPSARSHAIADVVALAHAIGAIVVVDGAQSAPHLPVDVDALDVDFYAFSGHKMGRSDRHRRVDWTAASIARSACPPYQTGGRHDLSRSPTTDELECLAP